MNGLDSIPLDSSGFLDMDTFPDDGGELSDDALAGLRDALLADPVEEPTDADWAVLVGDALDDPDLVDGPFTVDDDNALHGVRHEDDDISPTGEDGGPDSVDDDATEAVLDDDLDPEDTLDDDGSAFDLDGELGADDLVGLDLLDDTDLGGADDGLAPLDDVEAPADISPDFEDLL